jgi:hypothetical protein
MLRRAATECRHYSAIFERKVGSARAFPRLRDEDARAPPEPTVKFCRVSPGKAVNRKIHREEAAKLRHGVREI